MFSAGENLLPYAVCDINRQLIGISCQYIKELVIMPKLTKLPEMPATMSGIFNNRGSIINVVNLRMCFGMEAAEKQLADLIELMYLREQDHKNWIEELCQSTKMNRPFKLATDPHKCAFGKWFDNFRTSSYILSVQLEKFIEPHSRIHSIAHSVEKLKAGNQHDAALELIEKTRDTDLKQMITLFEETRELLKNTHREIAVILDVANRSSAVSVDRVISVEYLALETMESVPPEARLKNDGLITKIARRNNAEGMIYIVDPIKIIKE